MSNMTSYDDSLLYFFLFALFCPKKPPKPTPQNPESPLVTAVEEFQDRMSKIQNVHKNFSVHVHKNSQGYTTPSSRVKEKIVRLSGGNSA